ncbi:MAG: hypothetical protein HYZ58_15935 [Acidobacteria bacterium]|nr:hypothetical protein [Acidobacteriota bacterium]MBI3264615.1 hypothetical protein [Acidobacteriota bacterium]
MAWGLIRRVAREKRRLVLPLGVAAVLNVAAYVMVVIPLSARVSTAEGRARAAEGSLRAAERDHETARGAAEGKTLAQQELDKFYRDILPPNLAGARRITYRKLAELARDSSLKFQRRGNETGRERNSTLAKLRITMILEGQYENVRQFVHALETAPEFMVIENVALAESTETGGSLVLTIEVATYFRATDEPRVPVPSDVPPSTLREPQSPPEPSRGATGSGGTESKAPTPRLRAPRFGELRRSSPQVGRRRTEAAEPGEGSRV